MTQKEAGARMNTGLLISDHQPGITRHRTLCTRQVVFPGRARFLHDFPSLVIAWQRTGSVD